MAIYLPSSDTLKTQPNTSLAFVEPNQSEAGRRPVESQLMAETDGSHLRSGQATMGQAVPAR